MAQRNAPYSGESDKTEEML